MLGCDVCEVLGKDYDVTAYDIEDFDLVDPEDTLKSVRGISPQTIIHLAAFTDVEACEDETEKALAVNAVGAMNIAKAAREIGAYLVYVSTDYVFDGTKREPYVETDPPNPINHYGESKLQGERYVQNLAARHAIVRTSWLFGPCGKNFVDTIVSRASQGKALKVVNDQMGRPTYTMDLANGIRQVVERGVEGIIHLTNQGATTWFGLAKHAIDLAGVKADIKPVTSDEFPTKAKRPSYSVLGSVVAEASGIDLLPPWQEGVKHHLRRKSLLKEGAAS
jgi:dTDP-4-dehydrorhamnose reductase